MCNTFNLVPQVLQEDPKMVTFSPSDSEKSITFNIDDNIALEPPEEFMLMLTLVIMNNRIQLQPNDTTSISITDDDGMCSFHLI